MISEGKRQRTTGKKIEADSSPIDFMATFLDSNCD